jgi:hypothetical protein
MMCRKTNRMPGFGALALLFILPATALAYGVILQGDLMGATATSGHGTVYYKGNEKLTHASLRINLESVLNVDTVLVVIHGQPVATIALDANGNGSLHLATAHGDSIPALQAGDVVDIYSANGRVLLKGFVTYP